MQRPPRALEAWLARASAGLVHLYTALLEDVDTIDRRQRSNAALSAEERGRLERFLLDRNRREFLLAHGLLRHALSQHAPAVAPSEWRFASGPHGRPEIAGPPAAPPLRFNLTHTDGLVACVVTASGEVGVDAEAIDRPVQPAEIATRFFAPAEVAALRAQPEERQREYFFRCWTLKEAYLKACGSGFSLPLDRFSMAIDGLGPRIHFGPEIDDRPDRWRFFERQPSPRHTLAIAVGAEDGDAPPVLRDGGRPPGW